MVKQILKLLWCKNRKIFKVCLAIFQHTWRAKQLDALWTIKERNVNTEEIDKFAES